jgi:hypothetical protein
MYNEDAAEAAFVAIRRLDSKLAANLQKKRITMSNFAANSHLPCYSNAVCGYRWISLYSCLEYEYD